MFGLLANLPAQGGLLARAVLFYLTTTLHQRLIPLRLLAFLSHSTQTCHTAESGPRGGDKSIYAAVPDLIE